MGKDKKTNRRKRKKIIKWENVMVTLAIVALVLSTLYSGYTMTKPSDMTISWEEFNGHIESGDIAHVTIIKTEPYFTVELTNGEKYTCVNPGNDTFKKDILDAGVEIRTQNSTFSNVVTSTMLSLPMTIAMIVICYFLLKSLNNQASTLYKVYKPEDVIKFDQVAGMSETKQEVMFAVSQLRNSSKLKELGAKPCKGIIFEGPPGTGKTLLAKAIAGEADVPFISVCGADFIEMFVGLGAARVRKVWELAELNAPCIVFIDEIDAVGKRRSGGGDGATTEANQTLNALLQRMDGLGSNSGIFVIGATNRIDDLDPALLRPGRFDKRLFVGPPKNKADRDEVVKLYLKNKKVSSECDIDSVSKLLFGFTGAEIEQVLNEAVLISVQEDRDGVINMQDIDQAAMKQRVYGVSTRHKSEYDLEVSAVHEAGHAVMSKALGRKVSKISIIPYSSGVGGITMGDTDEMEDKNFRNKDYLIDDIKVLLAGRVSEQIIFGVTSNGCSNDIEKATILAYRMIYEFAMGDEWIINPDILKKYDIAIIDSDSKLKVVNNLVKSCENEVIKELKGRESEIKELRDRLLKEETVLNF